ncbi:DUF433 domain-containing protein [Nitrobacter winogradskyi]|nr:DUF433 domain-containing protein [Nitrobacter winogradskyi]
MGGKPCIRGQRVTVVCSSNWRRPQHRSAARRLSLS